MHQLPPRRVDSPKSRETGNPYFDIPNYLKMSPLVVLDPTQPFIKNITANAYQIGLIQTQFATAAQMFALAKLQFFDELHREMKEQGGVKKDYFLSYHKKKDRALDLSKNIVEEILLPKPQLATPHSSGLLTPTTLQTS